MQPRFQMRFSVDAWPCRIRKVVFFFYDHSPDAECGTASRSFVVGLTQDAPLGFRELEPIYRQGLRPTGFRIRVCSA